MANIRFDHGTEVTAVADTERVPMLTAPAGAREDGWATPKAIRRDKLTTINHSASGALTIDASLGKYFVVNLSANATSVTISNPPADVGELCIHFVQDATGARTVALPAAGKPTAGSDTAIGAAANARTISIWHTINGGTRWEYTMKGAGA